jgi:hypothetical protein
LDSIRDPYIPDGVGKPAFAKVRLNGIIVGNRVDGRADSFRSPIERSFGPLKAGPQGQNAYPSEQGGLVGLQNKIPELLFIRIHQEVNPGIPKYFYILLGSQKFRAGIDIVFDYGNTRNVRPFQGRFHREAPP